MKKRIIIGLAIYALFFIISSSFIIISIDKAASKLDALIRLHQVGILREQLLVQIEKIQLSYANKDLRSSANIASLISDVRKVESMADSCFKCHHPPEMVKRLSDMKENIQRYKDALSDIITMRVSPGRLEEQKNVVLQIGEELNDRVASMIIRASSNLESRTQTYLSEISSKKAALNLLIALGPVAAIALGLYFIRGITLPIDKLQTAARRIKEGNLDFKIEGLKDEFGTVANSFNEMSDSLKLYINEIREKEKRYRILFESAGDAIYIIDTNEGHEGEIVSANKAAAIMHGYSVDEMTKLKINDLITPDEAQKVRERVQHILDGAWLQEEIMHQRKDGSAFPAEVSAGLLEYMDHKYVLGFAREITERKKAEALLKKREQQLSDSQTVARLGSWEWDIRNNSVTWSDELFSLFGMRPGEFIGTYEGFLEFLHKEDRQRVDDTIKNTLCNKVPYHVEARVLSKDGREWVMEARGNLICDEKGTPLLLGGTAQDITERRKAEGIIRESEKKFRAIFNSAIDGILLADVKTQQFFTANPKISQMLGYSLEEIRNLTISDIHPEESIARVVTEFKNQVKGISSLARNMPVKRKDGSIFYADISATTAKLGEKQYLMSTFRDISDIKKTEEMFLQSRLDWEDTFNTITDMITIHDRNCNIILANKAARECLKLPDIHIKKGKCYIYYHGKEMPQENCPCNMTLMTGEPSITEMYEPYLGRHLEIRALPRFDKEHKVTGLIHIARDISESKRVEQALQRAEQMKMVGEWAAGLAHEIKNPLAGIKISVEVLADDIPATEENTTVIARVIDEIKRIEFLIKNLLDYAKPSQPHLSRTDINDILEKTISFSLRHPTLNSSKKNAITVSSELGRHLPKIMIDPFHLRQAFLNLMLNSIDAMDGGGKLFVRTYYDTEKDSIHITISDTGAGMDKELVGKIFNPFFTTKSKGSGLGLAITKRIVEQYGGSISVDSEQGKGTNFHISLPVNIKIKEEVL